MSGFDIDFSNSSSNFDISLSPPEAPAGLPFNIWNGSAWVSKPVKVWDGSIWKTASVKVYDGVGWS